MAVFFLPFFLGGHDLIKFWDSRHIQVAIYTVLDEESIYQVKHMQILEPGGKHEEKQIQKNKTTLLTSYFF